MAESELLTTNVSSFFINYSLFLRAIAATLKCPAFGKTTRNEMLGCFMALFNCHGFVAPRLICKYDLYLIQHFYFILHTNPGAER